ncbi:MAG: ABC-type transport auxiliary lipoprotein family protein [Ahrensia sp.]
MILRTATALLGAGVLYGCAAVTGGQVATSDTYELAVPQVSQDSAVRRGVQILIPEPTALKAVDSENIVIKTDPLIIQYLNEAQWSDRLPKLVQRRLADGFSNSGRFNGVGLPGQGLAIDYQVVTEIRAFAVDATSGRAEVEISAKLLDDRNGTIVANRLFTASAPVAGSGNRAFIGALDQAFAQVADDMVGWVTGRI